MRLRIHKTFELTDHEAEMLFLQYKREHPDENPTNATAAIRCLLEDSVEVYIGKEALKQRCRICGCTHFDPCEGGCEWVEGDLCSACKESEAAHV